MLGVFANSAIIQYVEDPYGCKKTNDSAFICPWNLDRAKEPGHAKFNERVLLWPIHMMDTLTRISEGESPYPN